MDLRLTLALPVLFVAGLGVGSAFFRGPASLAPAVATSPRERERSSVVSSLLESPAATDAKAQRLLAVALRKDNSLERDSELYLAIEAFTAEDFRRLVADVGALKTLAAKFGSLEHDTEKKIVSALITRWLVVDAAAAMAWAPQALSLIPNGQSSRDSILDILAVKRPEELLALVSSTKDASEREEIISRALRELAAQDPARARVWLQGCTDPADRRAAEKAIRRGTVQADPLRAVELAGSIEDRREGYELLNLAADRAAKSGPGILRQLATMPMKPWMLSSVLGEFGRLYPELAVDLAVKSTEVGGGESHGLHSAFAALARRDPAQAITKLEGLSGPQLAAAVSSIGTTWAARDPAAALAWLADRPVSERVNTNSWGGGSSDALVKSFADWSQRAQKEARAWADAFPAGATRDLLHAEVARTLAERGDAAEATRVLARLGSAADPVAIKEIAGAWAQRDRQAAADWAIAQAPGPAQSSALAGIVETWANEDPHSVQDWLAQFPAGDSRDRSILAFLERGGAWTLGSTERQAEFDAWFDVIDDPFRRAQAARAGFWQRKQRDPAQARAWLAALPNVDPEMIRMTLRDSRNETP